jgi:hypothetical protein
VTLFVLIVIENVPTLAALRLLEQSGSQEFRGAGTAIKHTALPGMSSPKRTHITRKMESLSNAAAALAIEQQ